MRGTQEELAASLASNQAVLVVGTGLSVAATGGSDTASWAGLIRSGAHFANEHLSLPPAWMDSVDADICMGLDAGYAPAFVAAAEKVHTALGSNEMLFRQWMQRDVGALTVAQPSLVEAVLALELPILTTNYDSLLEQVSGRLTTTWQRYADVQDVIARRSLDIAHLHGHWKSPESIILGAKSYGQILGDDAAQAIQRGLALTNSLIFIGCGDGIFDPNFSNLRTFLSDVVDGGSMEMFVLCKRDAEESYSFSHTENFRTVVYGDDYSDLEPFLRGLAMAPKRTLLEVATVRSAQQIAQQFLAETCKGEVIVRDDRLEEETSDLTTLLVPPVLYPVPVEEFITSQSAPEESRPRRAPAIEEASRDLVILVGEERSGLTSALRWLVSESSKAPSEVVPVYIDFRTLQKGTPRPLEAAIRLQMVAGEVIATRKDRLPNLSLSLDNFSAKPTDIYDRVMRELSQGLVQRLFVAVRSGDEAEIAAGFTAIGGVPVIRYLGRLSKRDITVLASRVAPARARALADSTLALMRREHLPRTPLTASLILSVLVRGQTISSAGSETVLLDNFMDLLLGRGDPHEDARFVLDADDRKAILSDLASHFVSHEAGSAPAKEVLDVLEKSFDRYYWEEDSNSLLENLKRRGVLTTRGGRVGFTQSSYLHLFAAKKAIEDEAFRQKVFENPVHFAHVIRHYSALNRSDSTVLRVVAPLLKLPRGWEVSGLVFNSPEFADAEPNVERAVAAYSDVDEIDDSTDRGESDGAQEDSGPGGDWLDYVDDRDADPFPFDRIEDASNIRQAMSVVSLVSNVVRDSERVTDLELKKEVFSDVLRAWGEILDGLASDEDFVHAVQEMANALGDAMGLKGRRRDDFAKKVVRVWPVLMVWGNMSANLSSRKLLRTLNSCLDDDAFTEDVIRLSMASVYAFDMNGPSWINALRQLLAVSHPSNAVLETVAQFAMMTYARRPLKREDEENLLECLVELQVLSDHRYRDKRPQAELRTRLRRSRTRTLRRAGSDAARQLPVSPRNLTDSEEEDDEG